MTQQTINAIRCVRGVRAWGSYAAAAFANKHNIPARILYLVFKLEAKYHVAN